MLDVDVDPACATPSALLADWCDRLDGSPAMTLGEVASQLATEYPLMTDDEMAAELRDRLRIALINGVLDVDTIADRLRIDLSGADIRKRIAGTVPMTLREYAHVRFAVAEGGT